MNKKNEMFDIEHIKYVLKENNDKSAEVIKENILKSSEAFAQDISNQDDLTLLILKVK
jgi:serine phosphatase RsbU (regulator of sigma subunit)